MAQAVAVAEKPDYQAKRAQRQAARKVAYENSSASQLAAQPARAGQQRPVQGQDWAILRQHQEARMNMLRAWRFSWMEHYQLLETYILPRRGIFINPAQPTANTMIRGSPINQAIVDPTGTQAMRKCAAGLMSGCMSPSRPWFKLKPALFGRDAASADAVEWFEECEDRMYTVMGRSNFYDCGAQLFEDLVVFGTGPEIIYEDDADIIRCYTPCPGEYFCASSPANRVESFFRLFVQTIAQIVEMFGLENCPPDVQQMWQNKGGSLEVEKLVAHAIEPNFAIDQNNGQSTVGKIPGDFTWRETYWIWGTAAEWPLSTRGFMDQPHVVPRWAVTSNDAYGRSLGMDVLPDIMQLQVETMRKAEAIEKMVRPPMLASMELKNEPASILPGKVTFSTDIGPGKGMRPIFEVKPEIAEMMEDIQAIQQRIKEGFFNDLFLMLETASNKNMTAYEVAQRQQEKLQVLGPVIERLQNEYLGPAIKRIFRIMNRKGLLPPIPASLQGVSLGIEYVGLLALAQKAASTAALERFAQSAVTLAATDPSVADTWNRDEFITEMADGLLISKKILNSPEKIAALRAERQKQMQQQQTMAAVQQGAGAVKDLSGLSPGGGLSAVSDMLGIGGSGAGG